MFVLNSKITIGKFSFSGVHTVEIKRSLHSYTDTAVIKIPSQAKIFTNNQPADALKSVSQLINEGDRVSISLGYDGRVEQEFEGFVTARGMDKPMEVTCEGYSYQLRLKVDLSGYLKKTTVKELLEMACGIRDIKGAPLGKPLTDVTVRCAEEISLADITLNHNNGLQVIDEIRKLTLNSLTIFFVEPKVLWCGFGYTSSYDGDKALVNRGVEYMLGYNCINDNGLKVREQKEPLQIIVKSTAATGNTTVVKSKDGSASKKDQHVVNSISDSATLQKIANEKQFHENYKGYTGHLTGFLQPYCLPGYSARIVDNQNPDYNGDYLVESTTVSFGISGARREVEIGPKLHS